MNKTKLLIVLICLGAGILSGFSTAWGYAIGLFLLLVIGILAFPKHIGKTGTWLFCVGAFISCNVNKLVDWLPALIAFAVLGGILHYIMWYRLATPEQRKA